MEDRDVFAATHVLVARLITDDAVQGLRIDHPDGLYDPGEYFRRVQAMAAEARAHPGATPRAGAGRAPVTAPDSRPLYLVAEKILSASESLPPNWPIQGTTGCNYCNELNGVFVDSGNARALRRIYRRFTRQMAPFDEVAYKATFATSPSVTLAPSLCRRTAPLSSPGTEAGRPV